VKYLRRLSGSIQGFWQLLSRLQKRGTAVLFDGNRDCSGRHGAPVGGSKGAHVVLAQRAGAGLRVDLGGGELQVTEKAMFYTPERERHYFV